MDSYSNIPEIGNTTVLRSGVIVLCLMIGHAIAGCGFHSAAGAGPDGGGAPAGSGACASFATLLALDTCRLPFAGDLAVPSGAATYDTDDHVLTVGATSVPVTHARVTVGGDPVDVISARNLSLADGARLRAVGQGPLVIAVSMRFSSSSCG